MQTIGKSIDYKFVEGAVINYEVMLSLSTRLQIMANHPLSPGLYSM